MDSQRNQLYSSLEQAQERIKTLQRVNSQLLKTIKSASLPEYKQLLTRLTQQQSTSSQTITSLHLRISHLQTELSFQQNHSATIISELQEKLQNSTSLITQLKSTLQSVTQENIFLKKQLQSQKSMIKNQEQLIDDYKKSIEEEKQIQREISRCELKEIQNRLKKDMQLKVQQIKEKHERKMAKMNKENLCQSYQKEIKNLEKYITAKKSIKNDPQDKNSLNHPFSSKKLSNKQKTPNNHILIFDTEEQSQNRKVEQKINNKQCLSNMDEMKEIGVFNKINSLESTLQSGIHNFRSVQKKDYKSMTGKKEGNCGSKMLNLFDSLNKNFKKPIHTKTNHYIIDEFKEDQFLIQDHK